MGLLLAVVLVVVAIAPGLLAPDRRNETGHGRAASPTSTEAPATSTEAPATPSEAAPTRAASPTATPRPVHSAPNGDRLVDVTPVVRRVELPDALRRASGTQVGESASSGPRVVFELYAEGEANGRPYTGIWLADLSSGSVRQLAAGSRGRRLSRPDISGNAVVWTEEACPVPEVDIVPGDATGTGCTWRILFLDLVTGHELVVDSGERLASRVRVDGDHVAYWVPDPSRGRPWGDRILVRLLSPSLFIMREIRTDLAVASLDMSDDVIAYTEGPCTEGVGGGCDILNARLMLQRGPGSRPEKVVDGAHDLALNGQRLVWLTSAERAQRRLEWAALADLRSIPVAREEGLSEIYSFSVAGDLVAWPDSAVESAPLAVWDARTGETVRLGEAPHAVQPSFGDGWLTWVTSSTLNGVPLAELEVLLAEPR